MSESCDPFTIHSEDHRLVVSLSGDASQDEMVLRDCRRRLEQALDARSIEVVAFDLGGLEFASIGALRLVTSFCGRGIRVEALNASETVREKLRTTSLDQVIHVRQ